MRWVPRAEAKPFRGIVMPQLGGSHERGYVDSGDEVLCGGDGSWDQRAYVPVAAVEQYYRFLEAGGHIVDPRTEEIAGLVAEVADLRGQLAEANRHLDAIDVMESAGFRSRKRPGRKPAVQREDEGAVV